MIRSHSVWLRHDRSRRLRHLGSIAVAGLIVSSLFFSSAVAHADEAKPSAPGTSASSAATHFRRAVDLYDEGDYAAALIEFQRAYDTAPDFRVLYNIGQAHYELRDYASAYRAFRRYLVEGGTRIPEQRREQIESDLGRLGQRIARVRVRVDREGAEVFIDKARVGTSPLDAPVIVNIGFHDVSATLGDSRSVRAIQVAGGDDLEVNLELGVGRDAASSSPGGGRRTLGYVLAGTGVAILVASFVSDVALIPNAIDEFEARRNRDAPDTSDAQSHVRTLQTVTLVGYIAGAAIGAAGAVLVSWPNQPSASPQRGAYLQLRGTSLFAGARF